MMHVIGRQLPMTIDEAAGRAFRQLVHFTLLTARDWMMSTPAPRTTFEAAARMR